MYVITLRYQPSESIEALSFYLPIYILMMAGLIIGTCSWIYVFNVNISYFRRVQYVMGLLLYHNFHCSCLSSS
jgi:phosphotransferase system  glucose/maltose/N-acetylglucosamine-specific IIC component